MCAEGSPESCCDKCRHNVCFSFSFFFRRSVSPSVREDDYMAATDVFCGVNLFTCEPFWNVEPFSGYSQTSLSSPHHEAHPSRRSGAAWVCWKYFTEANMPDCSMFIDLLYPISFEVWGGCFVIQSLERNSRVRPTQIGKAWMPLPPCKARASDAPADKRRGLAAGLGSLQGGNTQLQLITTSSHLQAWGFARQGTGFKMFTFQYLQSLLSLPLETFALRFSRISTSTQIKRPGLGSDPGQIWTPPLTKPATVPGPGPPFSHLSKKN